MNAADAIKLLQSVTPDQVMSVYSGKAGKCCCGCAGNHRYASKHVDKATKDRGYKVTSDEVNDRQVLKVLRLVQAHFEAPEEPRPGTESYHIQEKAGEGFVTHFSAVVGGRLYVAYLLPKT